MAACGGQACQRDKPLLPPYLGECLLSSDGGVARNDRRRRKPAIERASVQRPLPTSNRNERGGGSGLCSILVRGRQQFFSYFAACRTSGARAPRSRPPARTPCTKC